MHTQTNDVRTILHTTAMVKMPTVVPSFLQPGVGKMLSWLWARSVPRALDISQVYWPASSATTFWTTSSWLPGVKWCRSVRLRGWSPLSQVIRGGGLPVALHCRATVSPTDTTRSSKGTAKDGVSASQRRCYSYYVSLNCYKSALFSGQRKIKHINEMPYDLFYQSGKIFRSPSNTMSHCHAGRRFHKENELTSSHRNLHCPQLSNDGPVSLFFTKTMSILPHSEGISYLEYFTPKSFF